MLEMTTQHLGINGHGEHTALHLFFLPSAGALFSCSGLQQLLGHSHSLQRYGATVALLSCTEGGCHSLFQNLRALFPCSVFGEGSPSRKSWVRPKYSANFVCLQPFWINVMFSPTWRICWDITLLFQYRLLLTALSFLLELTPRLAEWCIHCHRSLAHPLGKHRAEPVKPY